MSPAKAGNNRRYEINSGKKCRHSFGRSSSSFNSHQHPELGRCEGKTPSCGAKAQFPGHPRPIARAYMPLPPGSGGFREQTLVEIVHCSLILFRIFEPASTSSHGKACGQARWEEDRCRGRVIGVWCFYISLARCKITLDQAAKPTPESDSAPPRPSWNLGPMSPSCRRPRKKLTML